MIEDRHSSVHVANEPRILQGGCADADGSAPRSQHLGQQLVGKTQAFISHAD